MPTQSSLEDELRAEMYHIVERQMDLCNQNHIPQYVATELQELICRYFTIDRQLDAMYLEKLQKKSKLRRLFRR